MNDRVVCVMSVGAGKYRKQYELVRDNLMAYAKKCHADFRFIPEIPLLGSLNIIRLPVSAGTML